MSNLPENLPADVMTALNALNDKSRLEVDDLKLMVLVECSGESFYNGLADTALDAECADLLRKNGREETAHAHRMKKAIEILTGEPYDMPSAEDNPYWAQPNPARCERSFLQMLQNLEVNGDAQYQVWADNEPNEDVAKLFRQNGKEETRHADRVSQVLARMAFTD